MSHTMIPGKKWHYITAMLMSALLMPDLLFELIHGLFELLEFTLDLLIEHVFHTDRHTTQVIVFYMLIAAACVLVRNLIRHIPDWRQAAVNAWRQYIGVLSDNWHAMALFSKTKLCLGLFVGMYLILTLFS